MTVPALRGGATVLRTAVSRSRVTVVAALAAMFATACTPTRSRLEPYRDDPNAQESLARDAARVCSCLRGGRDLPPHPFTTDGCSAGTEGEWSECCIAHDVAYWCGGSRDDRHAADERLEQCLSRNGRSTGEAEMSKAAVRAGGTPHLPLPWRWGYGWGDMRDYDDVSTHEKAAPCFASFRARGLARRK